MGLLRLFCIFIGIAICCEIPNDDGTMLFRSFFAFYIMFGLDYARMWIKGVSPYERYLGFGGVVFSLLVIAFNALGMSKNFVFSQAESSYYIVSAESFRLFPNFSWNIDSYFLYVVCLTMAAAVLELVIPYVNRYNRDKMEGKSKTDPKHQNQKEPKTIKGHKHQESGIPETKESKNGINLDGAKVSRSVNGGG